MLGPLANIYSLHTKRSNTINGIDYIARILKSEGVDIMTCYPSNPLIESAAKEGIRPVAFRHERGAIMAADGYSRTSDRQRFGVVAIQSQAGADNAMGGIAQAYADNIPLLVLPGGVFLNQISVKPNFSAVQHYRGITKQVDLLSSGCLIMQIPSFPWRWSSRFSVLITRAASIK